ncbi:prepilin-type N-terminal cleavage/methylation domain-containing protein [Sulfurovum sp. zt1-1]|uniref:Prepilin-type N-terminal cleavage/methylation domain-containing protein n=1 Tax=Sulfurovum zhangzhouensis TaxID=3019067 RepID=A0ABT7QY28_9BACT|nr:prepilin-type N-terminal cleavage/methylation domain-containing protein [Sulfurovum zhangzhouensis]MDM5271236.1 prepilin-type N-terminal cleavage/methylation domain-containing protein [Sulfurovum zhangzhouensis]
MISSIRHQKAFSLVELVIVITILGIVASIGSQIIVQVYESYVTQRAVHRSSVKTELAITQLVNRLTYSLPRTVIARHDNGASFVPIESIPDGDTVHNTLEWIAYDADGFDAVGNSPTTGQLRRPAWSGYADVTASTKDSLSTPGSRLGALGNIISNLSSGNSGIANSAILFPDTFDAYTVGYAGGVSAENIHRVSLGNDTTLTLNAIAGSRTIKEHYQLAWTAYAVVPENQHTMPGTEGDVWDLRLYYDYQPWEGENYTNGKSQILIRNVSVFNFTGSGSTIRLKLCQRENIGENLTINSCKEKAVIR